MRSKTLVRPPAPRTTPKPAAGGRVSWTVVLLSSLAIVGVTLATYAQGRLPIDSSGGGLSSTYADRPLAVQIVFYVHVVTGSLALLLGPFQFSTALRRRSLATHRWVGRLYVTAIAVASTAAFVMAFFSSIAFNGFFGFGSLALLWAWTTWRGYRAVREGDLDSHRAWMIRSFALTYAAVTLRTWLGVLIALQLLASGGDLDGEQAYDTAYGVLPFLCWLPNIVVAEFLVRRRGLPSYRLCPAPATDPTPDPHRTTT
ncbi:DUF2306 domain-containing protein [Streptomyces sp. NPDC002073]|uniref:DUF2306 domain-containing protein n=1 Tax=Streptomyces sp. NBC_00239 TaxID=2903640 RepID=UPI002E2A4668|nr:DUF2306 domain-containing protein [Streptomyces sp. NBC_00239]